MTSKPIYKLVETGSFASDFKRLKTKVKRLDEIVNGSRFILERDPSKGEKTSAYGVRVHFSETDSGDGA